MARSAKGQGQRSRRRGTLLAAVLGALVVAAGCSSPSKAVVANPTTSAAPTTVPTAPTTAGTTVPGSPTTTAGTTVPATGASSPVGAIWDYAKQEDFRPYLEQLQGGSAWYELEWCQVQPDPGVEPDWERADKNIARISSVGIEPMVRIRVGSCWATGGDPIPADRGGLGFTVSAPPADPAQYQDFVRKVVDRYQPEGVHTYSIENEVNGRGFWQSSAQDYEKLVRLGAEAVRSADPSARIIDSGLSSTTWGVVMAQQLLDAGKVDEAIQAYDDYYERRFARREKDFPRATNEAELRAALATEQSQRNRQFADVTFGLAKDGTLDDFQLHFYEKWTNIPRLMDYLKSQLPPGMPIDVWEAGLFWPNFDGDEQLVAGETTRLVYSLLGNGAARVIYLPLQSNSANTGDEIHFGLLDSSQRPRAAFDTLARLADFSRQGGGDWQEVTGKDGARAVIGTGPGGAQALVWSDGNQLALDAPSVTVSTLDGKDSGPATGRDLGTSPMLATAATAAELRALIGA